MTTLKFKTNINCDACVSKVTPVLNENKQVSHWEVDTKSPEKTLHVEGDQIQAEDIIQSLKKIGYQAESI